MWEPWKVVLERCVLAYHSPGRLFHNATLAPARLPRLELDAGAVLASPGKSWQSSALQAQACKPSMKCHAHTGPCHACPILSYPIPPCPALPYPAVASGVHSILCIVVDYLCSLSVHLISFPSARNYYEHDLTPSCPALPPLQAR